MTFDDAFLSVYEQAYPIMARLGLPGTVFVPTSLIGTGEPMAWPGIDEWLGGPYESELVGMSWQQATELADDGWEVGSHTRTHPHLTQVHGENLAQELQGSREDLEQRLSRPCPSLAYPYGDVDERVVEAAAQAGYRGRRRPARALGGRRSAALAARRASTGTTRCPSSGARWRCRCDACADPGCGR